MRSALNCSVLDEPTECHKQMKFTVKTQERSFIEQIMKVKICIKPALKCEALYIPSLALEGREFVPCGGWL